MNIIDPGPRDQGLYQLNLKMDHIFELDQPQPQPFPYYRQIQQARRYQDPNEDNVWQLPRPVPETLMEEIARLGVDGAFRLHLEERARLLENLEAHRRLETPEDRLSWLHRDIDTQEFILCNHLFDEIQI